jgi:ferredoxin
MRICPTNVIHPAGLVGGLEGLWTPVLNFRIGTSGCQHTCIACGNVCPTAAIRPISLDERLGQNQFAARGPIKIGTAFIDRGRCLPWAMDIPCIVCQENCPVSPKAIFTREQFNSVHMETTLIVKTANDHFIEFDTDVLATRRLATGDYFCLIDGQPDQQPRLIVKNTARSLTIALKAPWEPPPAVGNKVSRLSILNGALAAASVNMNAPFEENGPSGSQPKMNHVIQGTDSYNKPNTFSLLIIIFVLFEAKFFQYQRLSRFIALE